MQLQTGQSQVDSYSQSESSQIIAEALLTLERLRAIELARDYRGVGKYISRLLDITIAVAGGTLLVLSIARVVNIVILYDSVGYLIRDGKFLITITMSLSILSILLIRQRQQHNLRILEAQAHLMKVAIEEQLNELEDKNVGTAR